MIDPTTIRHYLLGELIQEDQRALVEERLLTDDDFFQEFELAKDDLIGEYVNNKLSPQERESFEQNFLTTPERRESLRQARALARYAEKTVPGAAQPTERKVVDKPDTRRRSWWMWFQPAPGWALAASLLVIVGLSFVAWRVFFYRSDVEQGLIALNAAYRRERPVEARLSGLEYAHRPDTRGRDQSKVDLVSRDRAQRYLLDAEKDEPGPASAHALGLFYLTELKYEQAIEQFKKALETDANNAQLHNDFGAALLEKAKQDQLNGEEGKSLEEFAESLEHLNRAVALNDSLLDALFNRALCRQYLSSPQAADDWRKYLEKDSQSPWADEARKNLKELESQQSKVSKKNNEEILDSFLKAWRAGEAETAWGLLCVNRDVSGGFLRNELLDRYLDHEANDRVEDARESLDAFAYAADLELRRANDHFLKDQIRFYQTATRPTRASLAEARQLMSAGHSSLQGHKREEAVAFYSKAQLIFDRLGDIGESLYVKYPMAHAFLLLHESERSLGLFQEVVREAEARQYKWLLAQSLSGLGNTQTGLDDYSASLDNSYRAQEISEQIGDIRGVMKAADQLSLVYTRLGNYRKAIESQNRAIALIREHYVEPLQAWRSHFLMATPLHLLGWNAAAEVFQTESLRIAQQLGPYYICRSHIGLGVIYGSQDNYEQATRNVRVAFDLAQNIPSKATRADTIAYSSLQLGHLYRKAGDFTNAIASYDEVLKIYNSDYPAFLYAAHKGKLLSCIAQGCPTVEQEIETTLNLFENYRSKILEEENKFVFFDVEQNVYDAVIEYKYSVNPNSPMAFDFSERSRARSLLGLTSKEEPSDTHHKPSALQPLDAAQVRQRMPEQAQLLQYAVLENKILMWLVSGTDIKTFEQRINSKDLRDKVSRYLLLLSSPPVNNEEEIESAAADFHDLLVKPVESLLDPNKELCIIPDKVLNYLPFGAFISRSSGKYLTQEYTLTRAPSSTIFIISSKSPRPRQHSTSEKLLSVGNPRFNRQAFPTLNDLPAAEREAVEIAALYNSSPAITRDRAIKSRIVSEMERADVIHLALHAVINEHSPLSSKLLFAKDNSSGNGAFGTDTLELREIYELRLPQTRLVVLSACQSGAGRYYDGEGVIGISRPFIAKGVPLVVASLWPVDSAATAELMISFHKLRIENKRPTAAALTMAQRQMLSSPDKRYRQPYYWASFVTIGGYAPF